MNVLIVEDVPFWSSLIQNFLKDRGTSSDIVINGLEAVKAIKKGNNYDAIIIDIKMPIMNGIDATIQIRILQYKKPIVCFSSLKEESDEIVYGRQHGINAFVQKSEDALDDLFEMLQVLCDSSEKEKKSK